MQTIASSRGRALRVRLTVLAVLASGLSIGTAADIASVRPKPYLNMPATAAGSMPERLSQTGAFSDLATLKPAIGLMPYDLVVSFWSDGARKTRFISVPTGQIEFSPTGEWEFPAGTVFVKTFELPVDEFHPQTARRLETRLLVRDRDGGVYGVTYRWRADGRDADLLKDSVSEPIAIRTRTGESRRQIWYYPSRNDCLTCHTAKAGGVLGVKTRQLNTALTSQGQSENQLLRWSQLGLLSPSVQAADLPSLPRLATAEDTSRSIEDRARSYLDANCAQCHRPGGTVAYFDARYDTPLEQQGLVNGPVLIDQGIDRPKVVSPHDIWRSILYMRADTNDDIRMPPLARETIDEKGVALLGEWIESMPGRDVVPPPMIAPAGGTFGAPAQVVLSYADGAAVVHYTTDGSVPATSDPVYQQPITVSDTAVVRARAFRDGYTRSITTQQVFTVGRP